MSSDLNYNFGFVVGEIVVPGHENLAVLTLSKIRTLTRVDQLSKLKMEPFEEGLL